jgi:putative heme-binding domain-containing protein
VAGRDVFLAAETQCSTCHAVTRDGVRRGGDIGPELTAIATKYGRPELFDAILNPNAGIAFGFDTWSWEEASGRVVSGFLLAESDEQLVVKDTSGVRQVLDAQQVVSKRKHALSTMPEGLATGMSAQQLADLVAFLREDVSQPLRRGEPLALFDEDTQDEWAGGVWSLHGWTGYTGDGKARGSDAWSVRDGVLVCEGHPIGYLRTKDRFTNYELELEWRFDPERGAGNSGVLLRVNGEDEVWPRSIEAQLHSGNAGDLWNIGEFGMVADPARTSGRRTTRLAPSSEKPLGEWNHYRITMDRGRLEVAVNGVVQNTAAWCDEVPGFIALQSEGAPIQFRNVVITPLLRDG